jgi:large subunit ribosomal protein L7Ae
MAEVNIQDKAYEAIELAKKTGKLKKGVNEVTKCVEKNLAKLVVTAKDVNPQEILMHIGPLCDEKEILFIEVPSKEDLGIASGLNVPTSCVAIIKEGDAKDLIDHIKKLKQSVPK